MDEQKKKAFFQVGTKECGLLCGAAGAALGLLLALLGLWKTLLVAAFFALGYLGGTCDRKAERFKDLINRVFPPKGE